MNVFYLITFPYFQVRNTSVLKGKPPVNRVEFNTSFDFKKVTQILTSQVIDCATKKV